MFVLFRNTHARTNGRREGKAPPICTLMRITKGSGDGTMFVDVGLLCEVSFRIVVCEVAVGELEWLSKMLKPPV